MPVCCVVGCHNKSSDAVSFHRFPKDDGLAKQWVSAVKRDNLPPDFRLKSLVCSAHFTEDDKQRDLRAELLGTTPRNLLIEGAVPSIFPHREPAAKRRKNKLQVQKETSEVSAFIC